MGQAATGLGIEEAPATQTTLGVRSKQQQPEPHKMFVRRAEMQKRAVFLGLLLVQLFGRHAEAARAGSSGMMMHFSRARSDAASFRWLNPPQDGLTVEMWFMVHDAMQLDNTLFAYSAFDSSFTPSYDAPNELTLSYNLQQFRLEHNELVQTVPALGTSLAPTCVTGSRDTP